MASIGKGIDYKSFPLPMGVIGIGLLLFVLGALDLFTLRLGSFRFPVWSMYILGLVFLGVGGALLWAQFGKEMCLNCNEFLLDYSSDFPMTENDKLLSAAKDFVVDDLTISEVSQDSAYLNLSVSYCPTCYQVGTVGLKEYQEYQSESRDIVEEHAVESEKFKALAEFAQAHQDDDDD